MSLGRCSREIDSASAKRGKGVGNRYFSDSTLKDSVSSHRPPSKLVTRYRRPACRVWNIEDGGMVRVYSGGSLLLKRDTKCIDFKRD